MYYESRCRHMEYVMIGRTGMKVQKNGFGALPIQRISDESAVSLLQKAYAAGINYYDTARAYSDSEKKLGLAFGSVRKNIFIATKTMAQTADDMKKDLEASLHALQTDY